MEIQLTQGKYAEISKQDYELVSQYKWQWTPSLAAWVDDTELKYRTVWQRMHGLGWSVEKSLQTPIRERG